MEHMYTHTHQKMIQDVLQLFEPPVSVWWIALFFYTLHYFGWEACMSVGGLQLVLLLR